MKAKSPKPLTPQQQRVVQYLVDGLVSKEIAFRMGVASNTIRKHQRRACAKLGAKTMDQMIAFAVYYGCVKVNINSAPSLDTP